MRVDQSHTRLVRVRRSSHSLARGSIVPVGGARLRQPGIVLSGGASDGGERLLHIKAHGGNAIVEEPGRAEVPECPALQCHGHPDRQQGRLASFWRKKEPGTCISVSR
jgi:hypothetical protein